MGNRVNIIYLTTRCNLDCDYCYEAVKRKELTHQVDTTTEKIDLFVREIESREADNEKNSIVVIIGGEPLLTFDKFEYLMETMSKSPRGYAVSVNTNGTMLDVDSYRARFFDVVDRARDHQVSLTTEISYDGIGHGARRYPDGSSSKEVVESAMGKLNNEGREFSISCVQTKDTANDILESLCVMCEKYETLKKIVVRFNTDDFLEHNSLGTKEQFSEKISPYIIEIMRVYDVMICGFQGEACEWCGKCNFDSTEGHRYSSPTIDDVFEEPHKVHKSFDKF